MSRVTYKNGGWADSNGPRPGIGFEPPSGDDYYFHVVERGIVLRWFNKDCGESEPLGEVYSVSGRKIASIPPFVHPAYRGLKLSYHSRLAWVQGGDDVLSFVMHCQNPQDFRLKLDLRTMEYLEPEFGVR